MKPENKNTLPTIVKKGEIVLYQPDESFHKRYGNRIVHCNQTRIHF